MTDRQAWAFFWSFKAVILIIAVGYALWRWIR